jgi:hypothetical protein
LLLMLLSFAILMAASLPLIVPIAVAITMPITPAIALFPLVMTKALPAMVFLLPLLTLLTFAGRRTTLRRRFAASLCRMGRMLNVGAMRSMLGQGARR